MSESTETSEIEPASVATGGAADGNADADRRSLWRLAYTPGDWLALAGPRAVVVLQPASPQWSELIATIWEEVLAATTIDDLLGRMASFRLEGMPNFAAFFCSGPELRSLVRGRIQLIDDRSGRQIADGTGMHTWSETALAGIERIRVQLAPPKDERRLALPLVVGAAGVSSLIVDTAASRQVDLGADVSAGYASAASLDPGRPPGTPVKTTADTSLAIDPQTESVSSAPESSSAREESSAQEVPAAGSSPEQQTQETDVFDESQDGRTLLAPSLPGAPQLPPPMPPTRVVAAVLTPSSGGRVEVDRPILVGRSPSASRVSGHQLPRLMTVPSPSHDISRTHLQILPGDGQVLVTDMNSTNGTILIKPDGQQVTLEPSTPFGVDFGSVIDLGDGVTIDVGAPGSG